MKGVISNRAKNKKRAIKAQEKWTRALTIQRTERTANKSSKIKIIDIVVFDICGDIRWKEFHILKNYLWKTSELVF
jgi:hypothetical protein